MTPDRGEVATTGPRTGGDRYEGGSRMRRMLVVLAAVLPAALLSAQPALADSPHFLSAKASIDGTTGALDVSFKEVGLGTTVVTEQVMLTVDTATAVYQCWNK